MLKVNKIWFSKQINKMQTIWKTYLFWLTIQAKNWPNPDRIHQVYLLTLRDSVTRIPLKKLNLFSQFFDFARLPSQDRNVNLWKVLKSQMNLDSVAEQCPSCHWTIFCIHYSTWVCGMKLSWSLSVGLVMWKLNSLTDCLRLYLLLRFCLSAYWNKFGKCKQIWKM